MGGKIVFIIIAVALIGFAGYLFLNNMEDSGTHEATIKVEISNDTSGYQFYQMIFDSGPVFNIDAKPGITNKTVTYTWDGEKTQYIKIKFIRNNSTTFYKSLNVSDGKTYKITI